MQHTYLTTLSIMHATRACQAKTLIQIKSNVPKIKVFNFI